MSWLPLVQNKPAEWRKEPPYEYYWERNFQTHPLSGRWDVDELYDLQADPLEESKTHPQSKSSQPNQGDAG